MPLFDAYVVDTPCFLRLIAPLRLIDAAMPFSRAEFRYALLILFSLCRGAFIAAMPRHAVAAFSIA